MENKTDESTTFGELKGLIQTFCEERDWDQFHEIKELAIGLSTEAAELLEVFRFQTKEQVSSLLESPAQREEIADEMADVLFFLLRMAQKYEFDLTTSFHKKMEKNAVKYPVEKAKGKNLKYTNL